jgi:hypothetical protein
MTRSRSNPWVGIGADAWMLGLESSSVIGLRLFKIAAGGPAAEVEARRMVSEKVAAGADLHLKALTGELGHSPAGAAARILAHYMRRVRANRRRLQKTG